jgi:uncharacterized LabA/DUF88 family protein
MKRIAILIDGGHLRYVAQKAGYVYDPAFIEGFAKNCRLTDEEVFRILYYDCAPYSGKAKLPVSGQIQSFTGSDQWLVDLSKRELFAVRRGVLKFRGFKPKIIPIPAGTALQDADFTPYFEQKGVDMRIGLDIALFSTNRAVDRVVLVSNDTDCVPALKHGRRAGLQIAITELPGQTVAAELLSHADFKRPVQWPKQATPSSPTQSANP